jgi:hypothetical protein
MSFRVMGVADVHGACHTTRHEQCCAVAEPPDRAL